MGKKSAETTWDGGSRVTKQFGPILSEDSVLFQISYISVYEENELREPKQYASRLKKIK